ncbi:MAG: hypothetical protein KKH29_03690 [Candidatus Omnitrophica bacterium]|nr:hypothetical protein [Candidatus Omnitrophota bacterium]MBU4473287.1 hypothetical protein [Candidatus Omnitrophota bacterium]MCG2706794.1 hypothetical protein [Candidatus Omnitrophota bacterium]
MKKVIILVILALMGMSCAWALEPSSSSFQIRLISFLNGGGSISSTNNIVNYSALGEGFGSPDKLTSTTFASEVGQLFLFILRPEELPLLISDLQAREEILGPLIPEATWQRDNDPYFYWNILVEPPEFIKGFSVSLDLVPDLIIDTDATFYQFPDDDIVSGKHTFFVLPFVAEEVAEQESLLQFDIWVDVDLPVINQISPSPGALITDNQALLSCHLSDAHSGLDLDSTTFTLNDQRVVFTYNQAKEIFEFQTPATLPEGNNTVLIKVFDAVGNNVVKGWDFIVDTQPPSGEILINGGEEITHSAYVFINIEAVDAVTGIKYIYISNDGVFDTELNHPYPYAPVIHNWLLAQPDLDGNKTVFVKFEDSAENLSQEYKDQITLRLLTPDTRIISGPTSITKEASADFTFEATKPGCLFSFRLDDQGWSEWSSSSEAQFSDLVDGNHYFYVKSGFDLNGDGQISIDEEDSTPAQWPWTIKTEGYLEKLRERILFWRR